MLGGMFGRIRRAAASRRRAPEHHVLAVPRAAPPPPAALVRLPRHPSQLLRTDAWLPITQLADQRIRAHRGDHLSIGEMVETVSHEVEDVVAAQPLEEAFVAWRTWAAVTGTPWPEGFHEHLVGASASEADDVEIALHVQADLAALMPQVVAARLSENRA
ncbi:hypothetical protein [Amnibacterium kyonggiense]|uniref:hypothetical protein n=1 Tax=Amnibacterium kyonggiense TaxID=595671 RepID=UPI00105ECCB7|nr:hypothetical protein [Amnibacterium kyonggiense]